MMTCPREFLGRCQTCLDNAMLHEDPCPTGHGNGRPLNDTDCLVYAARKAYVGRMTAALIPAVSE